MCFFNLKSITFMAIIKVFHLHSFLYWWIYQKEWEIHWPEDCFYFLQVKSVLTFLSKFIQLGFQWPCLLRKKCLGSCKLPKHKPKGQLTLWKDYRGFFVSVLFNKWQLSLTAVTVFEIGFYLSNFLKTYLSISKVYLCPSWVTFMLLCNSIKLYDESICGSPWTQFGVVFKM